jgi:hypothetical protein
MKLWIAALLTALLLLATVAAGPVPVHSDFSTTSAPHRPVTENENDSIAAL